jgi:hypothetical protein
MKNLILLLFLIGSLQTWSQQAQEFQKMEDSLNVLLERVRATKDLAVQDSLHTQFYELFKSFVEENDVFDYPFTKLSDGMGTLVSPDNTFRLLNWNVEYGEHEEQKYYCFILNKDPKNGGYTVIELKDRSALASNPEMGQYTEKNWYGCLYYKIIPLDKGGTKVYTLLGWDGNDMLSTKKIIETMSFQGLKKVKFGLPIFKIEDDNSKRRIIFQYSSQSTMSLKYSVIDKKHVLIYDHLSPQAPHLHEFKEWYVPDGSFDSMIWTNGKWVYEMDIDAKTGKKFKTKYNEPKPPNQ